MKLSEIRPCDACGGPIAPLFNLVRTTPALFNQRKTNEVLGLNQFFGGKALGLAEVMAPSPDVVTLAGDTHPELITELFICNACMCRPLVLGLLAEERNNKRNAAAVDQ